MRIVVSGPYGSGKSTLGRRIAAELDLQFLDYDDLMWEGDAHGLGMAAVRRALDSYQNWVIAGGEQHTERDIWRRAEIIVRIDPPLYVVVARVLRRALARGGAKNGVWDGRRLSRRPLLNPVFVAAAFRRYRARREAMIRTLAADPRVIVLRSDVDAALLARLRARRREG